MKAMNIRYDEETVLLLYPSEFPFTERFGLFRETIGRVITLNYLEYCLEHGVPAAEREIRRIVSEDKVSLVILFPYASDYQIPVDFYDSLRRFTKVVIWQADDSTYFESYGRYYAQAADLMVTSDPLAVPAYRRLGVGAIFHIDTTLSNRLEPVAVEKDIDVLFVGDTTKPGRMETLELLRSNGIGVRIFGAGSPEGWVPFERFSELFCRSRIVLNFSRVAASCWMNRDEPLIGRVRQNTGRLLETALAGVFCLTEYSPSLDSLLRPGEEIAVFHNRHELLEKVRYYLAHADEREQMARKAHERAITEHEPKAGLRGTIDGVFAALREPLPPLEYEGIVLSPAFRRNAVNSLAFSLLLMLRRGRVKAALQTLPRLFRYGTAALILGAAGGGRRAFALLLKRLR